MGRLYFAVFVLALFSTSVSGLEEDHDYLDDYFDQVVAAFNVKIEDVGISSLPVSDFTLNVNRTVAGLNVLGTVSYRNSIAVDVAELLAKKEGHRGQPEDDGVHLFYQINFPNMTFFSDVEVDLQPVGKAEGTAELFFLNTTIAFYLDKNYTLSQTNMTTKPYSTMGPSTNFLPVSDAMDMAARVARLELGYNFMWPQLDVWCNTIFTPYLQDIIKQIEFPMFPPNSNGKVPRIKNLV